MEKEKNTLWNSINLLLVSFNMRSTIWMECCLQIRSWSNRILFIMTKFQKHRSFSTMNIFKWSYKELKKELWDRSIFWQKDCPFCPYFYQDSPHILWKSRHWAVLINTYPYVLEGKHIMLVPKRHYPYSYEISSDESCDMSEAYRFIKRYFWEEDYFSFTRESFAERSVEHFHTHFISGNIPRIALVEMLVKQWYTGNLH